MRSRVSELNSLTAAELIKATQNDTKKMLLEPHLGEGAVIALGLRLELVLAKLIEMAQGVAGTTNMVHGPIGPVPGERN